jgi:mannitol/fructose-specific phosphotransferase system IIA component (Ntr-type)
MITFIARKLFSTTLKPASAIPHLESVGIKNKNILWQPSVG